MLARYKAELRAKGEKLTLVELDLPSLHGESNDVATLIAARAELLKLGKSPNILFVARLRWVAPGQVTWRGGTNDLGVSIQTPVPGTEAPTKSFGRQRGGEYISRRATWDDVAPQLASASPILSQVESVAQIDKALADIDYRNIPDLSSEHLALDTEAAWLAITALDEMHRGERDGAIERVASIISLSRRVGHEKLVSSQYYRIGLLERGLDVSWHLLQGEGWTEDELAHLERVWSNPVPLNDMLIANEIERAIQLRLFDQFRSSWTEWLRSLRGSLMWYETEGENYDFEMFCADVRQVALQVLWRFAWADLDGRHLLERWQVTLETARRAVSREALCEMLQLPSPFPEENTAYNRARFLCSGNWSQSLDLSLAKGMQTETRRQMTIVAIAMKRYELLHGSLPSTLSALVPEFWADIPRDLMDGGTIRYRVSHESKFVLYSIGIDCKDDGGDPRHPEGNRTLTMWQGRDAVWPQPASER